MNNNLYCVIMAGGVGSRFWPLSTEEKPKQFIDVLGIGKTFIQMTYERFSDIVPISNFVVMTNANYKDIVLEQLPMLEESQVLCEPARRNTAPCIAYAAYHIQALNKDAVMVVTPSDHLVLDKKAYEKTIDCALSFASENNSLMTIGLCPSRPETGYGYIQTSSKLGCGEMGKVKSFTEKPDIELAKVFVKSGEFLWNSGIFIWNCSSIINAFKDNLPDVYSIFDDGKNVFGTSKEQAFIEKEFSSCISISIDYGIMEKAENVYVCSSDFGWSDIGTWGSLYSHTQKDEDNNTVSGGVTVVNNTKNSIIRIDDKRTAIIDGLDNFIVVSQEDKLLICSRDNEQKIRNYIDEIGTPFNKK
ncbi:MAG: mannose-1-phosphate guanylyltransferase [Bacteroidetes bacterium]|nr:mannose-1-phosphate guanylyltransferase [Bacteroidota bacterium]